MKKLFTLFAVAMMAFAAQANELTVCGNGVVGEDAWQVIPVYGYWFDTQGMTQQIYPAEMLAEMAGGKITGLKFYSAATWGEDFAQHTVTFEGAEVKLALKEVEESAFGDEGEVSILGATVVASTVPVSGDLYLTFVLDEPFQYNGGNLLVQATWDGTGTYGQTYFLCEEQDRNCAYYAFDYYGEWTEHVYNILAKATFTYDGSSIPEPQVLKGDVNGDQEVNVSDAIVLINAILNDDMDSINVANADVDENGEINVTDAIKLINYILNDEW